MAYVEEIEKKRKLTMPKNQTEVFPRVKSNGLGQHVVTREERHLANSGEDKSRRSNGRILASSNGDTNLYSPNLDLGSRKRRIPGIQSNQDQKRRKISRNMVIQCSGILKQLMSHPLGWLFNQPVDPAKLNIPDYFSIVTEPMDLGTVMANLDQHKYSSVEEFEADVRLTFSNAILYNPPGNQVHIAAKRLSLIFDNRWRYAEAKWSEDQENPNFGFKPCRKETDANISRQINHVNLRIDNDSFTEKPSTTQTKPEKIQKDYMKQSVRNIVHKDGGNKPFPCSENANRSARLVPVCASCGSMKCQCHLQNNGIRAFSSDLSPERSRGRDLGSLRKTKPAKMEKDCMKQSVRNIVQEDGGNKVSSCPENVKLSTQQVPVCASCGSVKCQCHHQNNGVRAFSSDLSPERLGGRDLGSLRKTHHVKMQKDCRKQSVRNIVHKDGGNKTSPCPENAKRFTQLVPFCASCGSMKCQCHLQNNGVNNGDRAFSSDLSPERSGGRDLGSLRKIQAKSVKIQKNCGKQSVRNIFHEDGNKVFPCPENAKLSTQLVPVCASCGSVKCQCHHQNNGVRAFSSDLFSGRSGGRDLGSLRKDSKSKSMPASQTIKPIPDSDLDLNNSEGIQPPLSPKKALRAATLLARFSDLIVKTIHGNNADPVKIQEEKCKLEKQQEIEKQKIEDKMKAAKEEMKAVEAKIELQRKKEIAFARESERLALEKMEATIEMDDNLYSFKDFEKSCKCSLSDPRFSSKVLQSIGLFIKEDYHLID